MKLKIAFISDLHTFHMQWEMKMFEQGKLAELHNADVVVFCGDMSSRGYKYEVENFMEWFNSITPSSKKIFIAGNHDFFFDAGWFARSDRGAIRHMHSKQDMDVINEVLAKYPDMVYLNDSGFEWMGVKFWGSPITPWFHDWAFNRWDDEIINHWKMIPDDTDVLITHGPPFGILDVLAEKFQRIDGKTNVGCKVLLKELERIKPKVHAFGHIHEAYGIMSKELIEREKADIQAKIDRAVEMIGQPLPENQRSSIIASIKKHEDKLKFIDSPHFSDTIFVNASCLNEDYKPVNAPIVVDIVGKAWKI